MLDPVASLRRRVRLAPGASARLTFATGVAGSREDAVALAHKYHDAGTGARTFALAFAHARSDRRHLGVSADEAVLFERLASRALYADGSLRAPRESVRGNILGQASLWPHAVSGDLPILLVRVGEGDDLQLARQVLQAQEYWRLKGLAADVVLLNDNPASYLDEMQTQLETLLDGGPWRSWRQRSGGAFLLRGGSLSAAELALFAAAAAAVLDSGRGSLARQLDRPDPPRPASPPRALEVQARGDERGGLEAVAPPPSAADDAARRRASEPLHLANHLGGFADGGREYRIVLEGDRETPLPWTNVIANPDFGTIVSASGSAFTWSMNSRENRLTPHAGDSVGDPTGEAIYLRDERQRRRLDTDPLADALSRGGIRPRRGARRGDRTEPRWIVRHAAGITRFSGLTQGIRHELEIFVHRTEPVKFSLLTLTNDSGRPRRLRVFAYCEWALGPPSRTSTGR